jgi:hypothetical protein
MPVTEAEAKKFRDFTRRVATDAGIMKFDPDMTIWHYTNSSGFLGIVESGAIRATQVACVNDSTETLYATRLYRKAIINLKESRAGDSVAQEFLQGVLDETDETADMPGHANSKFHVACFSELEDNLDQWLKYGGLGGENGYAIGFRARGLRVDENTPVLRVNYDRESHVRIADEAAQLTLQYYLEGLVAERLDDPGLWARQFFDAWDQAIYRLSDVALRMRIP